MAEHARDLRATRPPKQGGFFVANSMGSMGELISLLSFALQILEIVRPGKPGAIRMDRIETGETELDLGFFRRRVTWTQRRRSR